MNNLRGHYFSQLAYATLIEQGLLLLYFHTHTGLL